MSKLVSRLRNNFDAARRDESGDIVQTLLIIALFVLIVIAIGKVIYDKVKQRADTTGNCIASANVVSGSNGATTTC